MPAWTGGAHGQYVGGQGPGLPLKPLRRPPRAAWPLLQPGSPRPGRPTSPCVSSVCLCFSPSVFSSLSPPAHPHPFLSSVSPSLSLFFPSLSLAVSVSVLSLAHPSASASPSPPPARTALYPLLCNSAGAAPPHRTSASSLSPSCRFTPVWSLREVSVCQRLPTSLPPPASLATHLARLLAAPAFSFPLSAPPSLPLPSPLEAPSAPCAPSLALSLRPPAQRIHLPPLAPLPVSSHGLHH